MLLTVPRRILPACLVLLLSSCGSEYGRVCTQIGCDSGLAVTLASPPATPFLVEAFVFPGGSRQAKTCNATPCNVFFQNFTPATVRIDVIAGTDTVTRDFTPAYALSRPNGPQCDPECRNATVTFVP